MARSWHVPVKKLAAKKPAVQILMPKRGPASLQSEALVALGFRPANIASVYQRCVPVATALRLPRRLFDLSHLSVRSTLKIKGKE